MFVFLVFEVESLVQAASDSSFGSGNLPWTACEVGQPRRQIQPTRWQRVANLQKIKNWIAAKKHAEMMI